MCLLLISVRKYRRENQALNWVDLCIVSFMLNLCGEHKSMIDVQDVCELYTGPEYLHRTGESRGLSLFDFVTSMRSRHIAVVSGEECDLHQIVFNVASARFGWRSRCCDG